MAYSAVTVLPADVWAATSTDSPGVGRGERTWSCVSDSGRGPDPCCCENRAGSEAAASYPPFSMKPMAACWKGSRVNG